MFLCSGFDVIVLFFFLGLFVMVWVNHIRRKWLAEMKEI